MICVRCNLRNCNRGRDMCDICHLNILDNSPKDMIDDTEILEYYMHKAIWDGCNECGNNNDDKPNSTQNETLPSPA